MSDTNADVPPNNTGRARPLHSPPDQETAPAAVPDTWDPADPEEVEPVAVAAAAGRREEVVSSWALAPQPGAGQPPLWQRLRLGRLLRRLVAVSLVAAALWWLALPWLMPVTSVAVVNARLVQVRAPIDGTTTTLTADLGDTVEAGRPLLEVSNPRVDTSHLATLKTQAADLAAHRARLARVLAEVTAARDASRAETGRYREVVLTGLHTSVVQARASMGAAQAAYDAAIKRMATLRDLARRMVATGTEVDDAFERESVLRRRLEMEQAAWAKLHSEEQAARRGVFLQHESPASKQRDEELTLRSAELRAELHETDLRLAAATAEVRAEDGRLARLARTAAPCPVDGLVWTRRAAHGQVVRHNELIYEVADRRSMLVEALLPQRHFSSIGAGARAVITLTGGRTLTGRVRAVRAPAGAEPSYAVNLADADLKQIRVIIALDDPAPDAALIGRHVRVLLTDDEPGPVQRAVAWLFAKLRV